MTQLPWTCVTAYSNGYTDQAGASELKKETAEKLAKAMDRAAVQITGGSDLETATSEVMEFLEWLLELMRRFGSYAQVRDTLLQMQEPSPKTRMLITASLRLAPRMVKTWFKSEASVFIAEQQDQKGHPFAIPADQHWAICLEISACELNGGVTKARAKQIVAKRHKVHPRTIHRIWLNRSHHPKDGVTIQEVEKFWVSAFDK